MPKTTLVSRACFFAFALVWLGGVQVAHAQEPSLAGLFQEYTSARERGDLPAAERAADAALQASERRDGDGGNTVVLAFNLARTRVELGQWDAARAPARRAFTLSEQQGINSRLDPLMSRLLYGRVRLTFEGLDAVGFVRAALEDAAARDDLLSDRYLTAEQLALWAIQVHRYDHARAAWALVADASGGATFDARLARGRARAYEGIAMAMQSVTRDPNMSQRVIRETRERFAEAHPLVQPFALLDSADGRLTRPQEVYAHLLAWDSTVWSKSASEDRTTLPRERLAANPTSVDGMPICPTEVNEGALYFPGQQAVENQIGAVVVRLRFNTQGQLVSRDIAASVGNEDFARMVERSLPEWTARVTVAESCYAPSVYFAPVGFVLRY